MIKGKLGALLQWKWALAPEFFDRVLRLAPRMTLVDRTREGDLHYYSAPRRPEGIWVVIGPNHALIAYANEETLGEIRDRVGSWYGILAAAPTSESLIALLDRVPDQPQYAARRCSTSGKLVVWGISGDWWFQFPPSNAPDDRFVSLVDLIPAGWPESYRERIRALREGS